MSDEIPAQTINGMFGILLNDLKVENEIKILARKVGLDPNLLVNIIDLMNNEPDHIAQNISVITNDLCEKPEVIGGIISLLKGDTSQVRGISQCLSVDQSNLAALMSLNMGKLENAKSFYPKYA